MVKQNRKAAQKLDSQKYKHSKINVSLPNNMQIVNEKFYTDYNL